MELAGQALVVAGAGGFFVSLLAGAEAATRRWNLHPEQSRKLAHVSSGVAAACLPLVMPFRAVVVLALLFVPFMVVSRRVGLFPAVHGVERATWGEVWFPLGVLLAAALFPHEVPYAFGVLVMGLSDAAASAAGHRWGRRAYRLLGAHKTYAGSAAFLAVTVVLATGALADRRRPHGRIGAGHPGHRRRPHRRGRSGGRRRRQRPAAGRGCGAPDSRRVRVRPGCRRTRKVRGSALDHEGACHPLVTVVPAEELDGT